MRFKLPSISLHSHLHIQEHEHLETLSYSINIYARIGYHLTPSTPLPFFFPQSKKIERKHKYKDTKENFIN